MTSGNIGQFCSIPGRDGGFWEDEEMHISPFLCFDVFLSTKAL